MSKSTFETICYCGVELDIDFTYTPPSRGRRDRYGCPEEPDEPASIEIDRVRTQGGDDITDLLSEEQFRAIEEKILEIDNTPDYDEEG